MFIGIKGLFVEQTDSSTYEVAAHAIKLFEDSYLLTHILYPTAEITK